MAAENEERMHKPRSLSHLGGLLGSALSAVSDKATLPKSATFGPNPTLPKPKKERIPTVHIATAVGWPEGMTPKAATGFQVAAYAAGFEHCRWLYVLPNGDVLVAETDKPAQPALRISLRGLAMKAVMNQAGSGLPSANRITLLRDTDGEPFRRCRQLMWLEDAKRFTRRLVSGDRHCRLSRVKYPIVTVFDDCADSLQVPTYQIACTRRQVPPATIA